MTKFERFLKQLDQKIANCKQFNLEYIRYEPRYFSVSDGHALAGIRIFLPPTTEEQGRLLYISTSMKVLFGEIATLLAARDLAELGIPEEDANDADAGLYGAFKVVGPEGISTLLSMATDKRILRAAILDMMGLGIKPLRVGSDGGILREYHTTYEEPEHLTC
jgi:hypothetical protein